MITSAQWQIAIEMAKLGYHVFPLADFGKMPRKVWVTGKYHEELVPEAVELGLVDHKQRSTFYIATNDIAKVELWAKEIPYANYAVACGPKFGVTIFDLDRHGPVQDGVEVVKRWRGNKELDCAFWVETPSNGIHLYYKPFKAPTRTVVSGVECQNQNSYVVGPGCKTFKGKYQPFGEPHPLNEAPEWLKIAACGSHSKDAQEETKLSILYLVAQYGFVPEGYRHGAVYKEAALMVWEDPDRPDEDVLEELRDLVDKYVINPQQFTDDELKRNIKNAKRNMTNDEGATNDLIKMWERS